MSWVRRVACILILAGIGVLLNGEFIDVGIVLLIEAGVLFTLVEKNPKRDRQSPDRSV